MNWKKFLLAGVAAFGTLFIFEFAIHNVLLKDLYQQTATLWRPMPEMMRLMWLMWILYFVISFGMTFIYTKGYEPAKSGLGQGFRFGISVGLLLASSMSIGSYFSIPVPAEIAVYWFFGGMAMYAAVGTVIGLIYKPN